MVALADVDGDGDLDLFVGRIGLANDLYLNDGFGRFNVVTNFPGRAGGASRTKAVSFGDVDGDGDLDAVVGNSGEDVLMLNDGSANFSVATFQSGTSCAVTVAFADFDGDGDLDALVGDKLMLGGSLGGFAADRSFDGGIMTTPAVALGDVDGDGDLDIILGNVEGSELLINDGTGSYSKDARFPGWIVQTSAVVCGDVDGDGDLDLVFGTDPHGSASNQLLINDGSGGFSTRTLPGGSAITTSLAFADVDADGDLDLLVGNFPTFTQEDTTGANILLLNDGTGEFTVDSSFPGSSAHYATSVAFGDLNGDGMLDIFIANGGFPWDVRWGNRPNQILLNQGSGSFIEDTSFDGGDEMTRGAALGDADGDGDLDILLGTSSAPNELLLNDGSGGFSSASDFPGGVGVGGYGWGGWGVVAFLDLDADGALDILIGNADHRANTLLRNDGSGGFSIDSNFNGGSGSTYAVALGDVDLDGDLDLIFGNQGGNELLLYTHCPNKGAQLHAASACFGCPPFMGRHSPSMCLECLPDVAAMGVIGTGESCSISCTLGQRPLGSDVCQYCKDIPGTSYDSSLPDRVSTDPATWAAPRCADCSSGTMADPVTGAVCLPCLPGQYTADAASVNCTACPPGSFSSGTSSTSCELCPVGGFCASVGAATASMTFEQCPGARACVLRCARPMHAPEKSCAALSTVGTYNPIAGAASNSCCWQCIAGKANPVPGSSDASFCVDCQPGTIAPNNGTGSCHKCVAGTFQNEAGKTACDPCPAGSYCAEGASAALPCTKGSYSSTPGLSSAANCTATSPGYSASTGSTKQTPCSPGTMAPQPRTGLCAKCEAGTFQENSGSTACVVCYAGSYCLVGAAAALPCVAGTFSSSTGLAALEECSACPLGAACSTGATEPGTLARSKCPRCSGPRGYPPHRRPTPSCSGLLPLGPRGGPLPLAC